MARPSRKVTSETNSAAPANPALDISALIAAEIAKALSASGLTTLPAAPSKTKATTKSEPAVTVIPPAEAVPLRVVTGYRDKATGKPVPFKGNVIKLLGLDHQPFGGVSLELICEILDRETEIVKAVKDFRPVSEEHKEQVGVFLNTLLGDE